MYLDFSCPSAVQHYSPMIPAELHYQSWQSICIRAHSPSRAAMEFISVFCSLNVRQAASHTGTSKTHVAAVVCSDKCSDVCFFFSEQTSNDNKKPLDGTGLQLWFNLEDLVGDEWQYHHCGCLFRPVVQFVPLSKANKNGEFKLGYYKNRNRSCTIHLDFSTSGLCNIFSFRLSSHRFHPSSCDIIHQTSGYNFFFLFSFSS